MQLYPQKKLINSTSTRKEQCYAYSVSRSLSILKSAYHSPSARLIKCWRDEGRGNQRNIRELETNMCTAGENGDVRLHGVYCVIISSKIAREREKEEKRNILQQPFLLDGSARRQKDLCAVSGPRFCDFVVPHETSKWQREAKMSPYSSLPTWRGGSRCSDDGIYGKEPCWELERSLAAIHLEILSLSVRGRKKE